MALWATTLFSAAALAIYLSTAGAENYNSKTHICCNGTVDIKGETTSCCGTKSYDTANFTCCGDQVFPLRESDNSPPRYGCCYADNGAGDAKPYDVRRNECCNGKILQKPIKDEFYGCCSGELFNYTSQQCCGKKVLERKVGDECCSGKVYNSASHLCCEKWGVTNEVWAPEYSLILEQKSNTSSCCGRVVYDRSTEVCCNEKILPKPDNVDANNAGCCGEEVIDYQNQMCCQTFTNDTFSVDNSKVHDKTGPGSSCCGVEAFDYFTEVCCNETVLPKPKGVDKELWGTCCGDQVMTSYEFQLCDNGRLTERNSTDIWSCGAEGAIYNSTSQICCFNEILDTNGDRDCCYLASRSYDKKTESCCGDKVVALPAEDISSEKLECCAPSTIFVNFEAANRKKDRK